MPTAEKILELKPIKKMLENSTPKTRLMFLGFICSSVFLGACTPEKSAQGLIEQAVAAGQVPAEAMYDKDLLDYVKFGGRDIAGAWLTGEQSSVPAAERTYAEPDFAATESASLPPHLIDPPSSHPIPRATEMAAEQVPAAEPAQPVQQTESFPFEYGGKIESVGKGVFKWLAPVNTEVTDASFIEKVKKLLEMVIVWFLVWDSAAEQWKIISPGANPSFWVYGGEEMYFGDVGSLQDFARSQGLNFETVPYSP